MAIKVVDGKCPHGGNIFESRCEYCDKAREADQKVSAAFENLSNAINGGWGDAKDVLADEVYHDHPTLSGQFAKAVAIGIMRRAVRDDTWKPGMQWEVMDCQERPMSIENPPHPSHDGRHSCQLVIGAMLMAQQWYV